MTEIFIIIGRYEQELTLIRIDESLKNENDSVVSSPSYRDNTSQSLRLTKSKPTPVRGSGFESIETNSLLNLLEWIQRLCRNQWKLVKSEHAKQFYTNAPAIDSLKKQFTSLHRKHLPTGSPMIPDEVRREKKNWYQMTERYNIACENKNADDNFGIPDNNEKDDDEYTIAAITENIMHPNFPYCLAL